MTEHTPTRGWFKSSRSASNAACVEVRLGADTIGVRDSKDVSGPALAFDSAAWTGFLTTLKAVDPS
ncbi:DUF397 domain-containing protein [Micromonospora sp. NBC_01813]|uniref:DUF397 domain-containing protein n=1 Tax=Micromonospora sp. NBC_01813 TaxID=2975988 RepID=UPI002DD9AEE6|nr:DUF397 domain-containing protein [Micromonospora sp. NBC_01813]WSA09866.1 DUF397 domain-containing protein [Micromonospora sp. NBC_01813]